MPRLRAGHTVGISKSVSVGGMETMMPCHPVCLMIMRFHQVIKIPSLINRSLSTPHKIAFPKTLCFSSIRDRKRPGSTASFRNARRVACR